MFNRKSNSQTSHIGPKMEVHGDVYLDESLRVEGILHGSVESYGTLEISHSGLIEGREIKARRIVIRGTLKADVITAESSILIARTARVEGKILADSIAIEEGAQLYASVQSKERYVPELPSSNSERVERSLPLEVPLATPILRDWYQDDFMIS